MAGFVVGQEQGQLDIFSGVEIDDTIIKEEIHSYIPYGSMQFDHSDEIRIAVQCQELMTKTYDSFIYIEGKLNQKRDASTPATAKDSVLTSNFVAFMFDEIRYELNGQVIDSNRSPGISSTIKMYLSANPANHHIYEAAGFCTSLSTKTPMICTSSDKNEFSACVPLKFLLGFAEDYRRVIVNSRQELVLIRAHSDRDCYKGDLDAEFEISKLQWRIPHIVVSDDVKLSLLERINRNVPITVAFRKWELYTLPSMKNSKQEVWGVKTARQLEKPRYVIIAFQTNRRNNKDSDASAFDHINISDIKLTLNSDVYPYERMALNFEKDRYQTAYRNYLKFQSSYNETGVSFPLLDYKSFKESPIFVLDCSKQSEALKSATVDIKLDFEAESAFKQNMSAYCLILHDCIVQYSPFSGEVKLM